LKTFYHYKKHAVITQERNTAMASAARKTSYNSSSDSSSSGSESSPGWNKVENHKKKKNSFVTGGRGGGGGQQRRQIASNPPHPAVVLPTKDIKDDDPLSICIPRAFKNTSSQRVFETFRRLNFGFIDGVDVVAKTAENGEEYVRVFVHFTRWNHSNPDAKKFRQQIVKGEQVNILYDQPKPWFWKCSLSRLSRLLPREPVEAAPVPAPAPAMSPMSPPPHLPRWGTAEYMNLFSIVDTINTKK
jgi:hypothetical protein